MFKFLVHLHSISDSLNILLYQPSRLWIWNFSFPVLSTEFYEPVLFGTNLKITVLLNFISPHVVGFCFVLFVFCLFVFYLFVCFLVFVFLISTIICKFRKYWLKVFNILLLCHKIYVLREKRMTKHDTKVRNVLKRLDGEIEGG